MKLGAPFGCNMCIIAVGGSFKMKKLFLAMFSFILFFSLLWTVPIAASSLKLSVTPIYNTSKYVTGNATKGVHIIVRNAAKRVLAEFGFMLKRIALNTFIVLFMFKNQ